MLLPIPPSGHVHRDYTFDAAKIIESSGLVEAPHQCIVVGIGIEMPAALEEVLARHARRGAGFIAFLMASAVPQHQLRSGADIPLIRIPAPGVAA